MLNFVPCRTEYKAPNYAHDSDTGADVYSSFSGMSDIDFYHLNPDFPFDPLTIEDGKITAVNIPPGSRALIPTGIKLILPPQEFVQPGLPEGFNKFRIGIQVRPKSGLACKQGLTVLNTPGTVDNSYTGELMVCVINHGVRTAKVSHLQKIAQIVPEKVLSLGNWKEISTKEVEIRSERNAAGFGSTGLQ